jgi:hypothetical protein
MAARAAALDPVQANLYLSAQERFNSILSHLRSAGRMTHSELNQFLRLQAAEFRGESFNAASINAT